MILCRVTGTHVAPAKHPLLVGHKYLIVEPIRLPGGDLSGGVDFLAIDTVDAGVGDTVLVVQEGSVVADLFGRPDIPAHTVILAVVDGYHLE